MADDAHLHPGDLPDTPTTLRNGDLTQEPGWGKNVPVAKVEHAPGFIQRPDRLIEREFFADKLVMPDGNKIDFWSYLDPASPDDRSFPAPTIRVRQGELVHTKVKSKKNAHTIHHHGIEPSDLNDGVGHTSFEIGDEYTYQWRPHQAGTYHYHCHVNTTLHFQMGMFGMLIVDPPSGPGTAFEGGPSYDVEMLLWPYDIDSRWHKLNHAYLLGGGWDPSKIGLHQFRPDYFTIAGVGHPESLTSPKTVTRARLGQTILMRHYMGSYHPTRSTFGGLTGTVIASDGRPLAMPFQTQGILSSNSERYDILLRPPARGSYRMRFEFLHWIHGNVLGIAETQIIVT